jgi:hypothetical protein
VPLPMLEGVAQAQVDLLGVLGPSRAIMTSLEPQDQQTTVSSWQAEGHRLDLVAKALASTGIDLA